MWKKQSKMPVLRFFHSFKVSAEMQPEPGLLLTLNKKQYFQF